MITDLILGLLIWFIIGIIWALIYNYTVICNYTPFTIFIGGPFWWVNYGIESIKNNKNKQIIKYVSSMFKKIGNLLRPRKK